MSGTTPGFVIEVSWEGNICPYCGQESDLNGSMCGMCNKLMMTVVLPICKDLLYNVGQLKKLTSEKSKKEAETNKEAVQELEIHQVLVQFPYDFAKRTVRFRKALDTEGVWFSHLVAYCFIKHLRTGRELAPPMIVCDPMYSIIRQQVFDFLQKEKPDPETCEAFDNVYHIPEAGDDAYFVIQSMVAELERLKRLKIVRPKTTCSKCGKEISTGKSICPDCERDEALNNRLAISSGMPQPLIQPGNPSESPGKQGGMHWRENE